MQFHSSEKGKAQVWWSSEWRSRMTLLPLYLFLSWTARSPPCSLAWYNNRQKTIYKKSSNRVQLYCNVKSWQRKYKVVTWQLAKGKPQEPPALILGLRHMHCPPLKSGCCQFCSVLVFVHSFLSTCSKVRGAIEGRRFCFWSPANLVPCFRLYTLVIGDVPQSEMTYSS